MGKQYTVEFKKAAVARLANETPKTICGELGISSSMLYKWKKHTEAGTLDGSRTGAKNNSGLSDKDKSRAVAMVAAGHDRQAVAKKYGVSAASLSYWKAGIEKKKAALHKEINGKTNGHAAGATDADAAPWMSAKTIRTALALLRSQKAHVDIDNPFDVAALNVMHMLEGKM